MAHQMTLPLLTNFAGRSLNYCRAGRIFRSVVRGDHREAFDFGSFARFQCSSVPIFTCRRCAK